MRLRRGGWLVFEPGLPRPACAASGEHVGAGDAERGLGPHFDGRRHGEALESSEDGREGFGRQLRKRLRLALKRFGSTAEIQLPLDPAPADAPEY